MACTSLWALMRVAGPRRKMYIGAWRWREEYIDEVRLNKRENINLHRLSNPSLWELGRQTAQWRRAFAALPGDSAQLPALTLEGSHKIRFQDVAILSGP